MRRLFRPLLAALLVACVPAAATAEDALASHAAALKRMELRFMMRGAQRRAERYRARRRGKVARTASPPAAASTAGLRLRPAPRREPPDPPPGRPPLGAAGKPATGPAAVIDRIVNLRAGDAPSAAQSEVSVGVHGNLLVAAWNDGEGFEDGSSTQGFGYSTDGGATWVDGGSPPTTGGIRLWNSDPQIAVNPQTGAFYFSALCEPTPFTNGIGVVKGTFVDGRLVWGTPRLVVSGADAGVVFDKEWLAVDSASGRLYLSYSRFTVLGGRLLTNRIEFSRNPSDNLLPWSAPLVLSSPGDAGRVQGPRIAVGPGGEVWATWVAVGTQDLDYLRVRRGVADGTFWESEVTAVSLYSNFGSGAPGFNRGLGITFPGLAVDRSEGSHRGRVFLTWNESLDFYDDRLGTSGTVAESEANDSPATATPFTLGSTLTGAIATVNDFDYWRFDGTQGETIICELDSLTSPTLDASFRLFCSDGATRLAFCETGAGGLNDAAGLIVFTLPSTGTYTLRVASLNPDPGTPAGVGGYRIHTGIDVPGGERARDHRDVFTACSDDGLHWNEPERVNQEPPRYDDWLPEVAVTPSGDVFASWYDWRDAPAGLCAGASMTYVTRSTDHGDSWPDGVAVSSALSDWTGTTSNLAPNEGDYNTLFADPEGVYALWGDGRNPDPDVYMARIAIAGVAALRSTHARPDLARITWRVAQGAIPTATVYRRADVGGWVALGPIAPGADGLLVAEDATVTAGAHYHYRLGLADGMGETFSEEVPVDVPLTAGPALTLAGVRPNPADREIWVSFALPGSAPASLELLDVAGRRVTGRTVSGAGTQTLEVLGGARLPTGIYLVRLTQDGQHAATRVSVVR